MALNTGVVRPDVVHPRGIEDVRARRPPNVLAARTVASLATYVPLHNLFGVNVVVNGMAAIARRARRPLHIVWRLERGPPIRAVGYKIWTPYSMHDVPLRTFRKIVVTNFSEVALLPDASVDQRDLLPPKLL